MGLRIITNKMIAACENIDRDLIQSYTGMIVDIEEKEEFDVSKQYGESRSYSLLYIYVDSKTVCLKDYSDDRVKRYIGEYIDVYTLDYNNYYCNKEAVVIAHSGFFYYILGIITFSLLLLTLVAFVIDYENKKGKSEKEYKKSTAMRQD